MESGVKSSHAVLVVVVVFAVIKWTVLAFYETTLEPVGKHKKKVERKQLPAVCSETEKVCSVKQGEFTVCLARN